MKCKLCEDKLLEYLYGELGEKDARLMEEHLAASEACRQTSKSFQSVIETVAELDDEGLPRSVHTRVMAHAEEARSRRRPFWAWMFRPAMSTAVIGAAAAAIYFTTLKYKAPIYLQEEIVSEAPSERMPKEPQVDRPSRTSPDTLALESKNRGLPTRRSDSHRIPTEKSFGPEQSEPTEEPKPPRVVESVGSITPSMEADSIDQEQAYDLTARNAEGIPTKKERVFSTEAEVARPSAPEVSFFSRLVSKSKRQGFTTSTTRPPAPIAKAFDLAAKGSCSEAQHQVVTHAAKYPGEEACGAGWLEVARCFFKKGDTEAARKAAEKAMDIPAHAPEARAFLQSLPPPAE